MKMNNKGLSFVELLMAGAISAGLLFFTTQYFSVTNKSTAKTQAVLENTLDRLSFEHRMRSDLYETKYSFNNLNVPSDDASLNFFDFIQTGFCVKDCARVLTIERNAKAGESNKSIYFLIKDSTEAVEQIFNPINAYDVVGLESEDDSNLKFVSLNKNNTLATAVYSPWVLPDGYTHRLIFVYAPTVLYKPGADTSSSTGKQLSFLGWLNKSNLGGVLAPELATFKGSTIYNNKNILDGKAIKSEDDLLRKMPFNSGLGIFAFVAPVNLIKYKIKTVTENGELVGKLFREDLIAPGKFQEYMIADKVDKLIFKRDTITNATVEMEIIYSKDKK